MQKKIDFLKFDSSYNPLNNRTKIVKKNQKQKIEQKPWLNE